MDGNLRPHSDALEKLLALRASFLNGRSPNSCTSLDFDEISSALLHHIVDSASWRQASQIVARGQRKFGHVIVFTWQATSEVRTRAIACGSNGLMTPKMMFAALQEAMAHDARHRPGFWPDLSEMAAA